MPDALSFSDYYRTLSSAELLDILDNGKDYQPLAVEAAQNELNTRQLSEEALGEARALLEDQRKERAIKQGKVKDLENKVNDAGTKLIEVFQPTSGAPRTSKVMYRAILLVYGGHLSYRLITEHRWIWSSITEVLAFPRESMFYLEPILILFLGVICFWRKMITGWMLLCFYIVYAFIDALIGLYRSFTIRHNNIPWFPKPSTAAYIGAVLFFGGSLVTLCKPTLREMFGVERKRMWNILAVCAGVTIAIAVWFY